MVIKDFLEILKYFFVKNKLIGLILLFPLIIMILLFNISIKKNHYFFSSFFKYSILNHRFFKLPSR